MPIKLCQNCGLKVFVEEGQPVPVPFLCARCNASMRSAAAPGPTVVMVNRPKTEASPAESGTKSDMAAAPAGPGAKSQLSCPGCNATFSVKLPEQPSRGKCPKCFQSLLVYPDGIVVIAKSSSSGSGVRPAVTDASAAQAASPSSSRVGRPVTQTAAALASASRVGRPATQTAAASASSASRIGRPTGAKLPAVAGSASPTPVPIAGRPASSTPPPHEPVSMEGPPAEGTDPALAAAAAAEAAQTAAEAPAEAVAAPAEAAPEAAPAEAAAPAAEEAAKTGPGRHRFPRRPLPGRPGAEAAPLQADGTGKIALTIGCIALPVLLGLVLYFMRTDPSVTGLLDKIGKPLTQGLTKMIGEPKPAAPAAPKAAPKSPAAPESPKGDAPKPETPAAPEAPKADAPKADAPKADAPKADAPKADAPKADAPAAPEVPKADAPKADAPATPPPSTEQK